MDVICVLNDKNTNYIINNNEIIYKTEPNNKNISCKFHKIINDSYKMTTNYYSEIIFELKENSLSVPINKKINTVVLLGDHNQTFSELIGKIIDEFTYETVGFNFYIHEIKYNGVYDLILNKHFDLNQEKLNLFLKTKIFFDCFDKDIKKKKSEIVETISSNMRSKKDLSYIVCSFENLYNKITIYNLSDLENLIDTDKKDIVNYRNYFGLIDYGFLKSALLNLDNYKLKTIEESSLMNYFYDGINNKTKVIYNLTRLAPKTWELVNLFYSFKNNSLALVPYRNYKPKPTDIIKKYSINNGLIPKYTKSNNVLKPKDNDKIFNYKILNKPSPSELNNFSGELVKYGKKHKIASPNGKIKSLKKISIDDIIDSDKSDEDSFKIKKTYFDQDPKEKKFELIKFLPKPQDPVLTFDKLMIYNKFMFNQCVKTHIKLQKAYRDTEKLTSTNRETICEFKALLTVMLDQINDL